MKILKIENKCGFIAFELNADFKYKKIEDTTKEDILAILDYAIENDIELDKMAEENELVNPVQKTIYLSLYNEFSSFLNDKDEIIKEVDAHFKEAENKYLNKD